MASLATTSHVPAWKKLGLELKFAKESFDDDKPDSRTIDPGNKKRSLPERNGPTVLKRQKIENGTTNGSEDSKDHRSKATSSLVESTPQDLREGQKQRRARKTVSFAADTKSPPSHSEQEREVEAETEAITKEKRRAEKRLKRDRRQKRQATQDAPNEHVSEPSDPTLTYLSVYHKARSQWKFQKNRETALVKHALSVDRIPSSYNAALGTYLSGLKSDRARIRVAEAAAEAIAAEDAELAKTTGQDEEKRQYEDEVSSFKEKLAQEGPDLEGQKHVGNEDSLPNLSAAWLKRLEIRKRAELVYFLMRGRAPSEGPQKDSSKIAPQAEKKRKRKGRTATVENSSSDSDGDDDDRDGRTATTSNTTPKKPFGTNQRNADPSSSSSDSSNDSSSSDTDSDSSSSSSS